MPFHKDHVYPYPVSRLGNPKPIEDIRRRIVPLAQGIVLEIGVVRPGVNFLHYDPAKVNKVYALEPHVGMLQGAEEQQRRNSGTADTGLKKSGSSGPGSRPNFSRNNRFRSVIA